MADARAEERLVDLVVHGSAGGRLYGLCGLKLLGSPRLDAAAALVSQRDDRPVKVTSGCTFRIITPADAIQGSPFWDACDLWNEGK
jgi:hypothetical protein